MGTQAVVWVGAWVEWGGAGPGTLGTYIGQLSCQLAQRLAGKSHARLAGPRGAVGVLTSP